MALLFRCKEFGSRGLGSSLELGNVLILNGEQGSIDQWSDGKKVIMRLKRTNCKDQDFIDLVALLDADLAQRDGEEHAFYHQFNSIQELEYTIVAYEKGIAVGCGALKQFDANAMEVKRMYVLPEHRGKSIATILLTALEKWVKELGYDRCILETGKRQPEAIALYQKNGYTIVPNYGQYIGIKNSLCFEKRVSF